MGNIIQANFEPGKECIYDIEGLEQWDQGQKLEISGLNVEDYVEVHFSLQEFQGSAKRMLGSVRDGIIHTDIPAFILEGPEYIYSDAGTYSAYAWIYVSDEESAETIRKMELVIKTRPKPAEYVTPDDLKLLEQIKEQIQKSKNDINTLSTRAEEHEASIDALSEEVADNGAKIQKNKEDIESLSAREVDNKASIDLLTEGVANNSKEVQKLKTEQNKATQDLKNKADKSNTVITDSLSMGRRAGTAKGANSTALGEEVVASGDYSHAEGIRAQATRYASHVEGNNTHAEGCQSHAEGLSTYAIGEDAHSEGYQTIANGYCSHAEGYSTSLGNINSNTSEDSILNAWRTKKFALARGSGSHIENLNCLALGDRAHVEGNQSLVYANNAHAEGYYAQAYGHCSHAEGHSTKAGVASEPNGTNNGFAAHAEGRQTEAKGNCTHAEGYGTIATCKCQHVQGKYNIKDDPSLNNGYGNYVHIVGCGNSDSERRNIHTISWAGQGYFAQGTTMTGADYAEYFEWIDSNPDNEDRIGLLVTLENGKIKLADNGDDILGIISGTAAVLGDNYECNWNGKYLTDDFGRIIYDEVEEFEEITEVATDEVPNEETGEVELVERENKYTVSLGIFKHPRINPDYDPNQEYVNRADRPEWDAVGLIGKLFVRDDGTCKINGYATVGTDGVATASDVKTNMRVLSRVNENVVRVLLK